MADDVMEAPQTAPETEREGVPGAEVAGFAGNLAAWGLMALGGLWVWVAVAAAALVGGGLLWQHERRRRRRGQSGSGRGTHGTRGTGRSLGLGRSGRGGTGRGPFGRGRGRGAGRGSGRGAGLGLGRGGKGRSGRRTRSGATPDGTKPGRRGRLGRRARPKHGSAPGPKSSTAPSGRARRGILGRRGGKGGPAGSGPSGSGTKPGGTGRRRGRRRGTSGPDPRRGDTKLIPDRRAAKPEKGTCDGSGVEPKAPAEASNPGTGPGLTPPTAAPTTPHSHQTQNPTTTTTLKGALMGHLGRLMRANSEEELAAANRYDPETMIEYLDDLREFVTAWENKSAALGKIHAISSADLPVDPQIAEFFGELHSLLHTVGELSRETVEAFVKQHETDLARHEAPRSNESKWNV
ncbi:hypothetical protein [Glycomyces artemisiae]|uniref:Uncharacterized protein n=1 Tax=Glycomyces artemisiae TaxID=1076443 RepID=A0A2T0UER5_9ACTN|nr:hypothetical protein [Glycomyces artemisiae]PRY56413.1 hypothetical protein B0I28_10962 [Glycomyces artemisiae]